MFKLGRVPCLSGTSSGGRVPCRSGTSSGSLSSMLLCLVEWWAEDGVLGGVASGTSDRVLT